MRPESGLKHLCGNYINRTIGRRNNRPDRHEVRPTRPPRCRHCLRLTPRRPHRFTRTSSHGHSPAAQGARPSIRKACRARLARWSRCHVLQRMEPLQGPESRLGKHGIAIVDPAISIGVVSGRIRLPITAGRPEQFAPAVDPPARPAACGGSRVPHSRRRSPGKPLPSTTSAL